MCNCCYKCSKRYLGCHSNCEEYIEYKNKILIDKERAKAETGANSQMMGYYKADKERRRKRGIK